MAFRIPNLFGETRPPDERVAELTEHLGELRTRIIRSCVYAVVGMVVVYLKYQLIFQTLTGPLKRSLDSLSKQHTANGLPGGAFVFHSFTDAFLLILQVSLVGGLILALPFIMGELWGFIAPALTADEKRAVNFVAPMSIVLFIMGLSCAFFIIPMAVHWFLGYLPKGAVLLQNPLVYIVFTIKLLLIFGVLFQLPVVLMFLGKVGIISSSMMKTYWRQISVALFTCAMVVAPSNDPGTMLMLAIPLTILFFASIWLVQLVEPKPESNGT